MYLISELISNIQNNGNSRIYLRNKGSNKYSCLYFNVIDGYLTILSKQYIFDREIWDGENFNKEAKLINCLELFQYSNDPLVKEKLNMQNLEAKLNAIIALIVVHSLDPVDIRIEKEDTLEVLGSTYEAANKLYGKVARMTSLSNQDMTELVDLNRRDKARFLREKMVKGKGRVFETPTPVPRCELLMEDFASRLEYLEELNKRITEPFDKKDKEIAMAEWKELSYDDVPYEMLTDRRKNSER